MKTGRKLMRRGNNRGGRCGDGEGNQERRRMGLRRATVDWWRGRAVGRAAGHARWQPPPTDEFTPALLLAHVVPHP
jgi:hypothetical protein